MRNFIILDSRSYFQTLIHPHDSAETLIDPMVIINVSFTFNVFFCFD